MRCSAQRPRRSHGSDGPAQRMTATARCSMLGAREPRRSSRRARRARLRPGALLSSSRASGAQPVAVGNGAAANDALALALLRGVAGCVGAFHTHAHEPSTAAGPGSAGAAAALEGEGEQAAAEAHAAAHRAIFDIALGAALRLPPPRAQPPAQPPQQQQPGSAGALWLRVTRRPPRGAGGGGRGGGRALLGAAGARPLPLPLLAHDARAAAQLRLLVARRCAPVALRPLASAQPRNLRAPSFRARATAEGAAARTAAAAAAARLRRRRLWLRVARRPPRGAGGGGRGGGRALLGAAGARPLPLPCSPMTHAPPRSCACSSHAAARPPRYARSQARSRNATVVRAPASFRGALVAALRAHAGGAADARPALWLLDALSAVAAEPLAAKAVGCALAATPAPTGARSATGSCVALAGPLALRQ
jgi:hypothetical protein